MMSRILSALLAVYRAVLSPVLHAVTGRAGACRFQPTCSEYAQIALAQHGPWRGGWLAIRRLLRCHPLHPGGFDPVPGGRSEPPQAKSGAMHV